MHPDDVVGAQHRRQRGRKPPVDVDVGLEEARLELGDVEPVVKHGPEHRVGVAEVVAAVVGFRHGDGGEAPFALDQVGLAVRPDLPVPAKPQRAARAHNVGQGDGDAARLGSLAEVHHTIGDQDDTAHGMPLHFSMT